MTGSEGIRTQRAWIFRTGNINTQIAKDQTSLKEMVEVPTPEEAPMLPSVKFKSCPIQVSLGVLGKKWTLLILRDIVFLKVQRFNQILRTLPGLTPRVLIMRLNELEKTGLIEPVVIQKSPKLVRWELTKRGRDTVPILIELHLLRFKMVSRCRVRG